MTLRRQLSTRDVALAMLVALLPLPMQAGVRLNPGAHVLDVMFSGFAVLRTNLTAEDEQYFDKDDQLPAVFTNRQQLNLRADGKLLDGLNLDARLQFDRESLRDWRYLMKLHGERGEVALGELDGAFQDTQFSRYDTPFYGVRALGRAGPLTAQAFSTTQDGSYRVDRLRGNNLSGPFILVASPVLEGSERVAIEIRDRRDPEVIVSSDYKQPGSDYTLDYAIGTVLFNQPIEAETFDGNPVFVVIEYRHQNRGGSDDRGTLGGARLTVKPVGPLTLGTTIVRSTGDATSPLDRGVIGLDQKLDLRWLRAENEVTGPGSDLLDRRAGACRFNLAVQPRPQVQVGMRFRRVGKDFDTIANPLLDTEVDRQSLDVDLSYTPVPAHRLVAGLGRRNDDIANDPEVVATRTRSWFVGWQSEMEGWPRLMTRFERRDTRGPASFGAASTDVTTALAEIEDGVGRWPVVGPTRLRMQYRWEIADALATASQRRAQYLGARLDSAPLEPLETFFETRLGWNHGDSSAPTSATTREFLLGGRFRFVRGLSGGSSLRWWANRSAGSASTDSTRTTGIVELRYEPSARLHARLAWEWTLVGSSAQTADAHNRTIHAYLVAVPRTGLTTSFGYQVDDQSVALGGRDGRSAGEYFSSVLYERGRLTLFGRAERGRSSERLPPFDATDSLRSTWLGGASWTLLRAWEALGELRDEQLTGAADAHRRAIVLELGRRLHQRLKVSSGVELTLDEQGATERLQRERVYVKLVGTL